MKRNAKTIGKRTKRAKRGTRERTPSLSLPNQPLGSLGLLIFFFFLHSPSFFFVFYPTKEPGPRLGEELNRKEIEATYAAAKKILKKKIHAYTGFKYFTYAIIVLHQYQSMVQILYERELFQAFFCCICTCKIFFAFKIIIISTCSLHLWVICNVASSKSFGRKQIYCYCRKTSK